MKATRIYYLTVSWIGSLSTASLDPGSGSHRAAGEVGLQFSPEVLLWACPGCWQNSVPCDCRNEVPISLLAISRESCSALRSHWLSLRHGPHRPFTTWMFIFFKTSWNALFWLLPCDQQRKLSALKGLTWQGQIHPDKLPSAIQHNKIAGVTPHPIQRPHCTRGDYKGHHGGSCLLRAARTAESNNKTLSSC